MRWVVTLCVLKRKGGSKMKILVTILMISFVLVSCKFNKTFYSSCDDYCSGTPSNIKASVIMPGDIRCHNMIGDAYALGRELGYCYNGTIHRINGVLPDKTDPNPEACDALVDQAKENCKKLPPDPSMMDQTVSGTTVFKDGKPFLIDAKPVKIKGEVCSCNQSK